MRRDRRLPSGILTQRNTEPLEPEISRHEQDPLVSPCGPDPGPSGSSFRRYMLQGPQLDPEAAYWTQGAKPLPRTVSIHSVLLLTTDPANTTFYIPPYPKNQDYLEWEISELQHLDTLRDDPTGLAGTFHRSPPASALPDDFLATVRSPISEFLQLHPPPFGAPYRAENAATAAPIHTNQHHLDRGSASRGASPIIATGRQLARMFEYATPGFIQRSALK